MTGVTKRRYIIMGILEGRAAIIVGASSGVGYGTALRFAQEGATVIASARRLSNLEALKEDAAKRGFAGELFPCSAISQMRRTWTGLWRHALINAAGWIFWPALLKAGLTISAPLNKPIKQMHWSFLSADLFTPCSLYKNACFI